jgi:multicomponent Na+:H+ antiporter subunit G
MEAEHAALTWLADGLILLGLLILTIGVYGMVRLPDLYTRVHAAGLIGFLGLVPFLIAAGTTGTPAIIFRVLLIGGALLFTSAIATHAVAHAAFLRGERLETPGAADETERVPPSPASRPVPDP